MSNIKEVDIIIAGGGSAGCVIAGRLAKADPTLEIAIIEQGPTNLNNPAVTTPGLYLTHLVPDSKTALFYVGAPSEHVAGRTCIVPAGGTLGGGSSINFMMATRAAASDYDDWNTEGWSSKELIPLLKKTETYTLNGDKSIHGGNGPLKVSYGGTFCESANQWLEGIQKLGVPYVEDAQDLKTSHGCSRWPKWIDPETGKRQDAAHHYVHNQSSNTNLHILTDSLVSRVLFEGDKAVGVEYVPGKNVETEDRSPKRIMARKLVIVTAGAIGSPQILQRSGIGKPEVLKKAGVDHVVVDLPVGEEYEDHQLILTPYRVSADQETLDDLLRGNQDEHSRLNALYKKGTGLLASNAIDASAKIRFDEKWRKAMGPARAAFEDKWEKDFAQRDDKAVMITAIVSSFLGDHSLIGPGKFITVGAFLNYPYSIGHVRIRSTDPLDTPDFNPGYLSHPADLGPHVAAYKFVREIVRRMPCYRGEVPVGHPNFSPTSAAQCRDADLQTLRESAPQALTAGVVPAGGLVHGATSEDAAHEANAKTLSASGRSVLDGDLGNPKDELVDIEYSAEDDEAIIEYVRQNVATTWHSCSTIKMKPREKGGCLDPKLNVYGTRNLKVCDLSMMPSNVGSNVYSTALLVGEKAALIIADELGIKNI